MLLLRGLLLSGLFLLVSVAALAQQGGLRPNATFNEDGFQVHVILISDSTFFEQWQQPTPPRITPVATYRRGEMIYPIIIFATNAADDKGNARITYDFAMKQPSGARYGEVHRDVEAWGGEPAPRMHLARGQLAIRIADDDPLGVYMVGAWVHDKVSGKTAPFTLAFEVVE